MNWHSALGSVVRDLVLLSGFFDVHEGKLVLVLVFQLKGLLLSSKNLSFWIDDGLSDSIATNLNVLKLIALVLISD